MIRALDTGLFEALKAQGWDEQGAAIVASASEETQKAWMDTWDDTQRLTYLDTMRADPYYAMEGDFWHRWLKGPGEVVSAVAGGGAGTIVIGLVAVGALIWVVTRK